MRGFNVFIRAIFFFGLVVSAVIFIIAVYPTHDIIFDPTFRIEGNMAAILTFSSCLAPTIFFGLLMVSISAHLRRTEQ